MHTTTTFWGPWHGYAWMSTEYVCVCEQADDTVWFESQQRLAARHVEASADVSVHWQWAVH